MLKKAIDLSQVIKKFTGEPFMTTDKSGDRPTTLKDKLIEYLDNAGFMGLTKTEEYILFDVGNQIGANDGVIEIRQGQYDVLKKIVDKNELTVPGEKEPRRFQPFIAVSEQVKQMIDAAQNVKEKDSK